MNIYKELPIFPGTQDKLDELVRLRTERGEPVNTPVQIVSSLIHLALIKEQANEKR